MKDETKDWGDYRNLAEEKPEFPLVRAMLLGADSLVHTPRLRAFETNEGMMAKFSESMDSGFVGRNDAVLQYTKFEFVDESTRGRMSNAVAQKP